MYNVSRVGYVEVEHLSTINSIPLFGNKVSHLSNKFGAVFFYLGWMLGFLAC